MLTIDENNLATLTIISIQNDDKTEQSYSCQLSPEKATQFENFAYNHNKRNLYPFCTDISFPIIKKITKYGKVYYAEFLPSNLEPLLFNVFPKDIVERICKNPTEIY